MGPELSSKRLGKSLRCERALDDLAFTAVTV